MLLRSMTDIFMGKRNEADICRYFKHRLDVLVETQVLEVVWVSQDIATKAWEVFAQFNVDKQWSYTDCVSYVVMKRKEITEAFAFDHHFEQMGFVCRP